MQKSDLISQGPLKFIMGHDETKEILDKGKFGGVLARAGIGKTSLLVQAVLPTLLNNKKILHVSLTDSVDKEILRYKEGLQNLAEICEDFNAVKLNRFWEAMLPNIFGLYYKPELFSATKLSKQLLNLKKEGIFLPDVAIIDGINFDAPVEETLKELQTIAEKYTLPIWFSIKTHREEELASDGTPRQFSAVRKMFDAAIWIRAKEGKVYATAINGGISDKEVTLNPATLLVEQ